jgi:hypothetical protein
LGLFLLNLKESVISVVNSKSPKLPTLVTEDKSATSIVVKSFSTELERRRTDGSLEREFHQLEVCEDILAKTKTTKTAFHASNAERNRSRHVVPCKLAKNDVFHAIPCF